MTETLAEKTCTPCRGGIPPLTHEEAERFRAQASDWELRDDAHRIERTFRFRNFREAAAFVQEISESLRPQLRLGLCNGRLADEENKGIARE